MSFFKDIPTLTEEEWANLHITNPLVKESETREERLKELVEKWCAPINGSVMGNEGYEISECRDAGAFVLDRVALWDAHRGEPIDFGDVLRMMGERLNTTSRAMGAVSSERLIALRSCKIDVCNGSKHEIDARFVGEGCRFGDAVNFESTTFSARVSFYKTSFGDEVSFDGARFQNRACFILVAFGELASFDGATFGGHARFGGAIFGGAESFDSATFHDGASFRSARFGDMTSFESADFAGPVSFGRAVFGDDTSFESADFGNGTSFRSAVFGDGVSFDSAVFGDFTSFERAVFGDEASFAKARFADVTSFASAAFGDTASFASATFGRQTSFLWSRFGEAADFSKAWFHHFASFHLARFRGPTWFTSAGFADHANFGATTFGVWTSFDDARFGDWTAFDSAMFGGDLTLGGTRFGKSGGVGNALVRTAEPWNLIERVQVTDGKTPWSVRVGMCWRRISARATEWIQHKKEWVNWSVVAALGRMPVLARVSYLALVVVPLIAGAWPSVRGITRWAEGVVHEAATTIREERVKLDAFTSPTDNEKVLAVIDQLRGAAGRVEIHADELKQATSRVADRVDHLPYGWVLAFGAALFAAVGHFIYAVAADERVRESTEQGFRKQRNDEFASADSHMRRDRLRRAFPHLKQVASLLPYSRHPNLVSRNGEAVWLPSTLEDLERIPERRDEIPTAEVRPDQADVSTSAAREAAADSAIVDDPPRSEPKKLAESEQPTIPHARPELEQIIIDEGARAEYDLAARERMPWAYVSGSCYLAAGLLVLWLVYIQLNVVMRAAGFEGWTHWVLRVAVVGAAAAIVYAARKSIATFWTVAFQWARRLTARSSPETAQPAASSTDAPDADDE